MDLADAIEFARRRTEGVLVTRRRDGGAQLSNILYATDADGTFRISATDARAKTRNIRRDPGASLYVPGSSFWSFVVLDGRAEISEVASSAHDHVVEELVELYRTISGKEHPDWEEYRRVMVEERRVIVRLRPDHAYGIMHD